ncbi:MAG TPA: PilN domain-containing protein [Phycisphaerales bacterium]|nr:PilN domain-containing protein [Phycisphaerales bacterium]
MKAGLTSRTDGRSNGRSNGRNGRNGRPGALAVLHTQEGRHRLLIARHRERWEVVEARTLQSLDSAVLTPLFEEHLVAQVVRVAPGRESIARCVQVPGGDDASLAGAVSLLAEAELPSTLPAYRRAGGVLPGGNADLRTGLLTGWVPSARTPEPIGETPEVWVSPVACLAMLRGDSGRAAVYCEASEGLICLLVPGPERTVARVTVEEPADGEEWGARVARAVEETAQIAGVTAASVGIFNTGSRASTTRRLLLESASVSNVKVRVSGVREDSGWLDDFGLALGAVLIAGSEHAAVRSLAGLHADTPRQQLSPIESATAWIARPRNAWAVIAASLVLMLLVPWGLAHARAAILAPRAESLKELKVGREGAEKKAAMYEQLQKSRWPMTKLLADISTAAPQGVVISQLSLNVGQGVTIKGTASSEEEITRFQEKLAGTRVFGNVSIGRQAAKGSGYEFDMTAKVTDNVHAQVKITEENDYAAKPLGVRLHGEGASNTAVAPASEPERRGGRRPDRDRGERSGDAPARTEGESRRPASTTPTAVPPPLTDADIAKMDRNTAMKEWSSRQSYAQKNPSLDSATKQRLKDEAEKCKAQMQKAATAAPAGGAPAAPAGAAPATPATQPVGGTK